MKLLLSSALFLTTLSFAMDMSDNLTKEGMQLASDVNKILSQRKFTSEWNDEEQHLFDQLYREILPRFNKLVNADGNPNGYAIKNLKIINNIFEALRNKDNLYNFQKYVDTLNRLPEILLAFAIGADNLLD